MMESPQNALGNEGKHDMKTKSIEDNCKRRRLHSDTDDNAYYGVHIPNTLECQLFDDIEKTNVFTDKMEALKLVKKYKKARFKMFNYYHEAAEFATHGSEYPNNNLTFGLVNLRKDAEKDMSSGIASEKCQFRGPKSQDLVKLRKAIETNDLGYVEVKVWENPRYLISSGDTPSILQEGFRYNGLHVAAKAKNAEMCELILNTVANVNFIERLYGEDIHQDSEERCKILLDLYLNTPDKGLNETPLHFAVKFGALKVTEVLASFPQCDKNVCNKYGKLPSQIICDRCDGPTVEIVKQQIASILEDSYYVPVLRSEDNCVPPIVGEPFSPTSPPNFGGSPLKSRLEIHAYAGPMDRKEADQFRKVWKTPPRSITKPALKYKCEKLSNSFDSISSYNLKLCDPEKGLEAVGRELATKYNVSWKEYWPFLDNFLDISCEDGLKQFENYLQDQNEKGFLNLSLPKETSVNKEPKADCPNFIDNLCTQFDELCNLDDDDGDESISLITESAGKHDDICPFVCMEHSSKIFANRICNALKNILINENTEEELITTSGVLTTEIKLFEQLVMSYIEDKRFSEIDFQCAHPRLADLIVSHLRYNKNNIVWSDVTEIKLKEMCLKNLDCPVVNDSAFSMDEHLVCISKNILKFVNENATDTASMDDYQTMWQNAAKCCCVFGNKQPRQRYSSRKRSSNNNHIMKRNDGVKCTNKFNGISKNLFNVDKPCHKHEWKYTSNDGDISSSDDHDDDEFYTPPSSPSMIDKNVLDDDQDSYDDSLLPDTDVFIEGFKPSKIDRDVYDALRNASGKLNHRDFPNIYKWRHTISLYTEEERKSWCSPRGDRDLSDTNLTSTPSHGNSTPNKANNFNSPPVQASPKSWFRVTGLNSPRASLNSYKNSLSFNL